MPKFYQFSAYGQLQCMVRMTEMQLAKKGNPTPVTGSVLVRCDEGLPMTAIYLNAAEEAVYHYCLLDTGEYDEFGEAITRRVLDVNQPAFSISGRIVYGP